MKTAIEFTIAGTVAALLCFLAYPKIMRTYHNTDGIGVYHDIDDPRHFEAPICLSNTSPGWSMYRGPNQYTYTVSQPGRKDTTVRTPWLIHPELQSVDCIEYRP